jgi:UDP-2,3-diacylglucosamine pyrophosphatase LpxH
MADPTDLPSIRVRSCFVSDIHLGFRGCQAGQLLELLRTVEMDNLFLLGDVVDLWALRKGFFWPQEHNDVLRMILGKAKQGTRVIYIPGNHDESFRELAGAVFGRLEIHERYVHETRQGKRLLLIHGDQFDSVVKCSPWLARLGDRAYALTLRINTLFNALRRCCGFPYWSLAGFLKSKVKNAVSYIANFERAVAFEARKLGVDGIVCGHIHRAEMTTIDGLLYCNDGDWVESCTALVEDMNGRLALWHWPSIRAAAMARPQLALEPAA